MFAAGALQQLGRSSLSWGPSLGRWAALAPAWAAAQARWYSPGYQPPSDDPVRAAFSYCISQVKQKDYEAYMWCIQLPKV